jgi:hypothetical protein
MTLHSVALVLLPPSNFTHPPPQQANRSELQSKLVLWPQIVGIHTKLHESNEMVKKLLQVQEYMFQTGCIILWQSHFHLLCTSISIPLVYLSTFLSLGFFSILFLVSQILIYSPPSYFMLSEESYRHPYVTYVYTTVSLISPNFPFSVSAFFLAS